jgi:hypothetical protein
VFGVEALSGSQNHPLDPARPNQLRTAQEPNTENENIEGDTRQEYMFLLFCKVPTSRTSCMYSGETRPPRAFAPGDGLGVTFLG